MGALGKNAGAAGKVEEIFDCHDENERCSAAEAAIRRDRHHPERSGVSDDSERCRAWSPAALVAVGNRLIRKKERTRVLPTSMSLALRGQKMPGQFLGVARRYLPSGDDRLGRAGGLRGADPAARAG